MANVPMVENYGRYEAIEQTIRYALEECAYNLSLSEIDEIKQFLNANEYGLALETFVAILSEGAKPISPNVLSAIGYAAAVMDLPRMWKIAGQLPRRAT